MMKIVCVRVCVCVLHYIVQLLPAALQNAIAVDAEFRQSLPIDYLNYMGRVHSNYVSSCM